VKIKFFEYPNSGEKRLDKLIRKKIKRKIALDNICWGGLPFYQYELEEYLNKKLSERKFEGTFAVTSEAIEKCKLLWASIPDELKLTLHAGILIPIGFISFSRALTLPDLDIKILGIGWHRYFLFHSAMGLWVLKSFFEMYSKFLENSDNPVIVKKVLGTIGAGSGAAIGIHLLKDGAFGYLDGRKSVVFGIPGIFKRNTLIKGTYLDDDLWLLGNSLWAFKVSGDIFVIAFGEEIEYIKKIVKENFVFKNEKSDRPGK